MKKIKTADYLIEQLAKLGIRDVFGLPGDYDFEVIEAVQRNKNTAWIGCTNELNAGYAADGYARIKGYGAVITTYGVGELSAINAIAGSYAESVPVVMIAGVPATKFIKNNTLIHHNFEQPDYQAFYRAYTNVTAAQAYLDESNAKEEIDRVLSVMINEKKPIYIAIPVDVCSMEIENEPDIVIKKSDEQNLKEAVTKALETIEKSQKPIILADVLVERFCAVKEAKNFIEKSGFPVTTLVMGKGLIDFDYPNFIGTYLGKRGNTGAYDFVNSSDCVITIGAIYSDMNTAGFDYKFNPAEFIEILGNYTIVNNKKYENVLMKDILTELSKYVAKKKVEFPQKFFNEDIPQSMKDKKLTSDYIYPRIQEFLRKDDIIFTDTGIAKYGFSSIRLPEGANWYNQTLWGSIGWATPATFGAGMAAKDKRVILYTGEGSHQLTATEVSSMMRHNLKPIIIVLNNSGYTIERVLSKDPDETFNDIANWDYSKLPHVFDGNVWTAQARTEMEFDEVLNRALTEQKTKMCYIEIFTGKMDLPSWVNLPYLIRNRKQPS